MLKYQKYSNLSMKFIKMIQKELEEMISYLGIKLLTTIMKILEVRKKLEIINKFINLIKVQSIKINHQLIVKVIIILIKLLPQDL